MQIRVTANFRTLLTTAEEWGRAYWLDNRARIINELAYWYKRASGIERSMWAKEHPLIAADVERRANGL